jgi:hypothetical protein
VLQNHAAVLVYFLSARNTRTKAKTMTPTTARAKANTDITVRPLLDGQKDPQWYVGHDGTRDASVFATRATAKDKIRSRLHWSYTGRFLCEV